MEKNLSLVIHLEKGILTSVNYGACDIKPVVAGDFETSYGLTLTAVKTQAVVQSIYCTARRCAAGF